ncbi:MAG: energy-coupling factor transporter ATPase [Bacillota bacterium]
MFIGTDKLTHTYMPGTPFATEALKDVSFAMEKGAFTLILGRSGSGKTTFVQHLNGLLRPTTGKVLFDRDIIDYKKKRNLLHLRRRIGLVFQMPEEQFFTESVYDEVAFAPRNLGFNEKQVAEKVKTALQKVNLDPDQLSERHPFQLSAGQKRLVAIAAVLSLQPEVLIFDEPTAGLDAAGKNNFFKLLQYLNQNEGLSIIISTHHLDEIASLANQVLVLENGRLVMDGFAEEIFTRRDELTKLGLALPPVTEIMHNLHRKGFSVNRATFTLAEARREINDLMRRR